jgi:O-succinylbenzoic acid--CoA ligase
MNRLVALALATGPRFVDELKRAFDEGDAVLPVDLRLAAPAIERVLALMRPAVLVAHDGERTVLDDPRPVEPGDGLVMATSGTTGEPKGVVLTHDAIEASARATSARIGADPATDRWWACLPFAHIGGLSVVLRAWATGVPVASAPYSPEAAIVALQLGATLTSLVPTALRRLDPETEAGFRCIVLGGQAPPGRLPDNVVSTYGLTETGSGVVYDGMPLEEVEVRVADDGEIFLRGPMLLRAYRDGTDPKTPEGWLPTGDAGSIGPAGLLQVKGRIGELIITGGENVWPASVEPLVERHPAVREAAVAGRPDKEWGEHVTAYVVVDGAVEAADLLEELRDLVRGHLAGYAAPREVVLVDSLPRTAIGKLRRDALAVLDGPSASL